MYSNKPRAAYPDSSQSACNDLIAFFFMFSADPFLPELAQVLSIVPVGSAG